MSDTLTIDWQKSPAHLFFLSTFLRPRTAQDSPISIDWSLILGEGPYAIVKRWLAEGILQRASLTDRLASQFTVQDLRRMLRERGLRLAGRKDELILRLLQADPNGMEQAVADLPVLECSDLGRKIAVQYLSGGLDILALEQRLPPQQVRKAIKWILCASASGVLGNAAYDALKEGFRHVRVLSSMSRHEQSEESSHFKRYRDYRSLSLLVPRLFLGMSRSHVGDLFGTPDHETPESSLYFSKDMAPEAFLYIDFYKPWNVAREPMPPFDKVEGFVFGWRTVGLFHTLFEH